MACSCSIVFLVSLILCFRLVNVSLAYLNPSYAAFELESSLEFLLVNDTYNVFKLQTNFYPKSGTGPICIPITFRLSCAAQNVCEVGDLDCSNDYNVTFLWTSYDTGTAVGKLLLQYALSGIMVKGFNWGGLCLFKESTVLTLRMINNSCINEALLLESLEDIASKVKGYALYRGSKIALNDEDSRGYAVNRNLYYNKSSPLFIIVTTQIVALSTLIFFLSVSAASFAYEIAYNNIKGKQSPGYPMFWGVAVFTFLWDIAPSWLVLDNLEPQISVPLAILTALLLVVALLVPKRVDFPIPCTSACHKDKRHVYLGLTATTFKCKLCLTSFLIQSMVIWLINIFLAMCTFYAIGVLVALFLNPVLTLVKLFFIKAVVTSVILNTALMISNTKFQWPCWKSTSRQNFQSVVGIVTPILFLFLLIFIATVIGNVVFTVSWQAAGVQSIFTIILPLLLVCFAWFSRGTLFPNGDDKIETDPAEEIIRDIEKGLSHKDEKTSLLNVRM